MRLDGDAQEIGNYSVVSVVLCANPKRMKYRHKTPLLSVGQYRLKQHSSLCFGTSTRDRRFKEDEVRFQRRLLNRLCLRDFLKIGAIIGYRLYSVFQGLILILQEYILEAIRCSIKQFAGTLDTSLPCSLSR